MNKFYDADSQLTFLIFDEKDFDDDSILPHYNQYIEELNSWSNDEGIKTYIEEGTPLGSFFSFWPKAFNTNPKFTYKHIIALDEELLVGSALLSCGASHLTNFLNNNQKKLRPIISDNSPLITIEYITTNPSLRGHGYGTRIIKGIDNRKKSIFNIKDTSGLYASARPSNTPSQRAFLKNNFVVVPAKNFIHNNQDFVRLYSGKHKKIFTNEK